MMRKTLSILLTVMLVAALCVPLQAHATEAHAARQPDYSFLFLSLAISSKYTIFHTKSFNTKKTNLTNK